MKRTIVISAVNIRKGGTLTILRNCLEYLSNQTKDGHFRVIALVHKRELCDYPEIEYIEMPDIIKSWGRRLWCEYVTMYRISQSLAPVYLWFSLHDTTPRVVAERQVVYCQTSFPFLHWQLKDVVFDYKIVLFALFTRFAYCWNIRRNKYLIVQAEWLRKRFSQMFRLPESSFIVVPPRQPARVAGQSTHNKNKVYTFLFAATPDCHKNFELVCQAAQILEKDLGINKFKVVFTIDGTENRYSRWLYGKWGHVTSLEFAGFMERNRLYDYYACTDCLIFPSRIETWGLPISEFAVFDKPMLLADLSYAHETAGGSKQVAFFNPLLSGDLKIKMEKLVLGDSLYLKEVPKLPIAVPTVESWERLFDLLLER